MAPIFIDDIADPRVAEYADVALPERLLRGGRFVVEGRLGVERLLGSSHEIESLLLSEAAYRALVPVLSALVAPPPVFLCGPRFFERMTGHHFHRGCLALVRRPPARDWRALARATRSLVVLEAVANSDNVGGVFRNAAAFGAGGVLLGPGCADPLYRKAVRTSMAHVLDLPFAHAGLELDAPWPQCLAQLRDFGFQLIALTPRRPSLAIHDFVREGAARPFALLIGSEGAGSSQRVEELSDVRLRIDMLPHVDSLNLSVATGIALELLCRRARAAAGAVPDP